MIEKISRDIYKVITLDVMYLFYLNICSNYACVIELFRYKSMAQIYLTLNRPPKKLDQMIVSLPLSIAWSEQYTSHLGRFPLRLTPCGPDLKKREIP